MCHQHHSLNPQYQRFINIKVSISGEMAIIPYIHKQILLRINIEHPSLNVQDFYCFLTTLATCLISIECGVRCSSPRTIEISPLAVTNHSPHLLIHQEIVLKLSMLKSIHLLLDDATWFVRRPSLKFCVLVVILSLLEILSLSFASM